MLLAQLIESILEQIPDSQLIMANTDGSEIKIPRQYEKQYCSICKKWCEITKLELEFVDYQKMIITDVNYWHRNLVN